MDLLIEHTPVCCATCGVLFTISKTHRSHLEKSEESFYCPNGHKQYYTNPLRAKNKQLESELARLKDDRDWYAKRASDRFNEIEHLNKVINGYKGAITRMKKARESESVSKFMKGEGK